MFVTEVSFLLYLVVYRGREKLFSRVLYVILPPVVIQYFNRLLVMGKYLNGSKGGM